jgi:DNA-binding transcriptional LysR family regulator
MSLHIAKLEGDLGFKLFYRDNRKVTLTNGGKVFLEEARKIIKEYEDGVLRGLNASLGFEGILKIGFTNYIERLFFPEIVNLFHRQYPKTKLIINQSEQWQMIDEVRDGTHDLALVFPYELEKDPDICIEKIADYTIEVVVNKDHPFATSPAISVSMLNNESVIIIGSKELPSIYKRMWMDWKHLGLEPKAIIETKSLDSILFMVESGLGLALLPSYIREIHSNNLCSVPLTGEAMTLDTSVAYLHSNNNPVIKPFLEVLREKLDIAS